MRIITIKANERLDVPFQKSTSLYCLNSNGVVDVKTDKGESFVLQASLGQYNLEPFTNVYFKNENDFDVVLEVEAGSGNVNDNRSTISGDVSIATKNGNTIDVKSKSGDLLNNKNVNVLNSKVILVNQNESRTRLGVQNRGASSVFIGDLGVNVTNGWEIEAGERLYLDTGSEIYAVSENGTCDVRIMEAF